MRQFTQQKLFLKIGLETSEAVIRSNVATSALLVSKEKHFDLLQH